MSALHGPRRSFLASPTSTITQLFCLLEKGLCASAFALVRPAFEAYVRGEWLAFSAIADMVNRVPEWGQATQSPSPAIRGSRRHLLVSRRRCSRNLSKNTGKLCVTTRARVAFTSGGGLRPTGIQPDYPHEADVGGREGLPRPSLPYLLWDLPSFTSNEDLARQTLEGFYLNSGMNPSNALERANLAGKAKALVSVTSHTLDGIELFLELPDRRKHEASRATFANGRTFCAWIEARCFRSGGVQRSNTFVFLPLSKRLDWQERQKEIMGGQKWCTMPLLWCALCGLAYGYAACSQRLPGVAGGPFHFPKRHHLHAFHS